MHISLRIAALAVASWTFASLEAMAPAPAASDAAFGRLMAPERVAPHVWVMRQPDRLWAAVIGNVTIIEQADGVVLIDSGGSIEDGRQVADAVARLTRKPIKAVAITHWHNDHPLGLPTIVERNPNVRIISTPATLAFIATETKIGVGKPDKALEAARYDRGVKTRADFEKEAANPTNAPDLRAQYAIEARWVAWRIEQRKDNYAVLPTETVAQLLTLPDPVAPVDLRFFGTANTHGDLVAWLPRQKVIVTGDIVVLPTPYGFDISTGPWLAALERMDKLPFRTLVPGHGPVQHDRRYLATLKWSMKDLAANAATAAQHGTDKERAFAQFDLRPHEARFGARDSWSRKWLRDYWLEGMFGTAFDEAKGIPAPGK